MNRTWRDDLLHKLTPGLARLTLAVDPDHLLLEESIAAQLRARGFELYVYEDSLAFRYTYESTVRARWDHGEEIQVIVVVQEDDNALQQLPYPLVEEGRVVEVGLAALFPMLSYRITAGLYPGDLDQLWQAVANVHPQTLGDEATADFLLRHVYRIAAELIKEPSDLLRILLRRHYNNQRIPPQLDAYLIGRLQAVGSFHEWPLERIVPERDAFLDFLQQRWPAYLRQFAGAEVVAAKESGIHYSALPGPAYLPFGHDDVRVYVDNLFLEGLMQAVEVKDSEQVRNTWAVVGVHVDPDSDRRRRIAHLIEIVNKTLPNEQARHDTWLSFAPRWAELTALILGGGRVEAERAHWQELCQQIDQRFRSWLDQRYAGLHNQPSDPPVMVHHIPRAMARRLESAPDSRLALLVLDGLALDQWHTVRTVLQRQRRLPLHERAVFAWIPTLTPVSRQAIFAGQPPYFYGDTIGTTEREPQLWTKFWIEHGIAKRAVGYQKGLGTGDPGAIVELSKNPTMQIVGLVIDSVDTIMHGMKLGAAGMHSMVRHWAETGYLAQSLAALHDAGFTIWITADHGNVEATGIGRPGEKAAADIRGERARVYPSAELRTLTRTSFATGDEWLPVGLPKGYYPLLAQGRTAFAQNGEVVVAHGGAAIEEVIVPLIQIEQD